MELQNQAQLLQAQLMGPGAGLGAGSTSISNKPDAKKTRPSEGGLRSVSQLENQNRRQTHQTLFRHSPKPSTLTLNREL